MSPLGDYRAGLVLELHRRGLPIGDELLAAVADPPVSPTVLSMIRDALRRNEPVPAPLLEAATATVLMQQGTPRQRTTRW